MKGKGKFSAGYSKTAPLDIYRTENWLLDLYFPDESLFKCFLDFKKASQLTIAIFNLLYSVSMSLKMLQ
ncbi:MAG TPA: hypothetical protein DCM07_33030 [Planctomycetaceae bacterium]|nr:hypothetical protein [Gimesia sp.]HAH49580.1 hypothetical protein [Planctomycetaceae bacterium]HBL44777.1 hypothetical protein [Planctomycetaceae bacterium]